jgi:hypothetical protein
MRRINEATTRYFVHTFTTQIALATCVEALEVIEAAIDKRILQGVLDIKAWYDLDRVWFHRKMELSK